MPRVKKNVQQVSEPYPTEGGETVPEQVPTQTDGATEAPVKVKKPRKPRQPKKKVSEKVSENSEEVPVAGDVLKPEGVQKKKRTPSAWNAFVAQKKKENKALTFAEISALYKQSKAN